MTGASSPAVRVRSSSSRGRPLLVVDGVVNLLLGVLLLTAPDRLVRALGLPEFAGSLYPTVLGGVLVGIAAALFIESRPTEDGAQGLGVVGAVVINVAGAGALTLWLALASQAVPTRGRVTLGIVAAVVFLMTAAEVAHGRRRRPHRKGEE